LPSVPALTVDLGHQGLLWTAVIVVQGAQAVEVAGHLGRHPDPNAAPPPAYPAPAAYPQPPAYPAPADYPMAYPQGQMAYPQSQYAVPSSSGYIYSPYGYAPAKPPGTNGVAIRRQNAGLDREATATM
jgi:hypothetical protein